MSIADAIEHADRYQESISILVFDLDNFKKTNDSFGHHVGDEVLKMTAKTALKSVRSTDIMFRIGGDEFLILMPQTTIGGAALVAEKLRAAIENTSYPVIERQTASIGVSERMKRESFQDLFIRTDNALYKAKENGRNCVARG